jgi:spore germination protein GerM
MDRKRLTILGFLFVFLVVLVFIFFKTGVREKIRPSPLVPTPESMELPGKPGARIEIVLFFLSEKDTYLHSEKREIDADVSLVRQAKLAVEELLKGSQLGYISPFPPQTKLRELHVTRSGVAYVDFSKDIVEKHLSGSSAEISTIYSVVNSLAYNFDSIKRVFILIEGREKETLGGHISLSKPFLPLYDLIAK